jgi:hypothetical protein
MVTSNETNVTCRGFRLQELMLIQSITLLYLHDVTLFTIHGSLSTKCLENVETVFISDDVLLIHGEYLTWL